MEKLVYKWRANANSVVCVYVCPVTGQCKLTVTDCEFKTITALVYGRNEFGQVSALSVTVVGAYTHTSQVILEALRAVRMAFYANVIQPDTKVESPVWDACNAAWEEFDHCLVDSM